MEKGRWFGNEKWKGEIKMSEVKIGNGDKGKKWMKKAGKKERRKKIKIIKKNSNIK